VSKIVDSHSFQEAVKQFDIVPRAAVRATARSIPWLEVVSGALLISGLGMVVGASLSALLLLTFCLALLGNLLQGHTEIDCQCFGRRTAGIGWSNLIVNVTLLGVASVIIARPESGWPLREQIHEARRLLVSPAHWLSILAGAYAATVFLIVQAGVELLSLTRRAFALRIRAANGRTR
jgi:hypothetical protein